MAQPFLFSQFLVTTDMPNSVKQKKPIQCSLFFRGFFFHMQVISY